ncbi:hypothetical protein AB0A77_22435 [Streptomyces varsoviensis]|uniref:restriction endonuclease subunit S n=1 Tax=Streptomyces varsoviensis TaxID=67373 RepID=UPI0033ED0383
MKLTEYRVGEIMRLARRTVDVRAEEVYHEIGLRSFGNGVFHKSPVYGEELGAKKVFHIEPGDLLFSNVFAWEGAVALASDQEAGKIGSHRFMTYKVDAQKANSRYLLHYFSGGPGLRVIREASPGSAGRNRTLGIKNFERQIVQLPDPGEQRRVADKIDKLMSKLGTTAALSPGSEMSRKLAVSGLDQVLGRWATGTVRVDDACALVSDTVHPGDDPSPAREFVGLEHIAPHFGTRIGSRPLGDEKGRKFRFASGDVLYGYLRPYLNKVWLADRAGLCSVEQYVLRPNGIMPGDLLAAGLRSKSTLDKVLNATHNLQLPRLRSGLLMAMEIPRIPRDRHKLAVADLNAFMQKVRTLDDRQRHRDELLTAVRPALLNAAFSGQL